MLDEHAEGGAPVADVVLADHLVTELLQGACEGVTDDGGAQVTDVHLLGDVRCGVVEHHGARGLRGRSQALVGGELGRLPGDPVGADRKSTRLNSSHVAISYAV